VKPVKLKLTSAALAIPTFAKESEESVFRSLTPNDTRGLTSSRDDENDQAQSPAEALRSESESGEEDRHGRNRFENVNERD